MSLARPSRQHVHDLFTNTDDRNKEKGGHRGHSCLHTYLNKIKRNSSVFVIGLHDRQYVDAAVD